MAETLTRDQVLALAPDPSSIAASRSLSARRAWLSTGRNDRALWGECKGSAKEPYRTQVDLASLASRCSCPSRKFPCKHGLGLMLLLAAEPEAITLAEPPPWVSEWLAGRDRAAEKRQEKDQEPPAAQAGERSPARPATNRSAASREARVAAGIQDLELWLQDRARAGLATVQAQAPETFGAFAGRMVDAQAPGVARLLREAGDQAATGGGWQGRMLDRLGRLHLLTQAYRNFTALPPELQADVRATIGFTQSQDELLATDGLRDSWLVLGRHVEEEDKLHVQRTWLWGAASARPALLLSFGAPGQPIDRSLTPGLCIDAELVFFPGAAPLRALLRARHGQREPFALPAATLAEAAAGYAAALAANPWLERALLLAGPCTLAHHEGSWRLRDQAGDERSLPPSFAPWRLLAITGGQPFVFAGEWDGERVRPLCAQWEGRMIALGKE
jgi:hypothetical protein